MAKINLEDIALLIDVATLGSIGAAAPRHSLSQPQASRRMTDLERQLGIPILVRSNRGTMLTSAGKVVVDWATLLLNAADNFTRSVDLLKSAQARDTTVAASMTIAEHLVPRWLARLTARHPEVRVTATIANSAEVAQLVRDGEVALGFVETSVRLPGLQRRRVGGDRLRIAVHPAHPWARRDRIGLDELADGGVMMREPGSGTRDRLTSALRSHGVTLTPGATLASNAALKAAALAELGPVVLSELSLGPELRSGQLVSVDIAELDLARDFWAVTRPHDTLPEGSRLVLDAARASTEST